MSAGWGASWQEGERHKGRASRDRAQVEGMWASRRIRGVDWGGGEGGGGAQQMGRARGRTRGRSGCTKRETRDDVISNLLDYTFGFGAHYDVGVTSLHRRQ